MTKIEEKILERETLIHLLCESTLKSEICSKETHEDCRTAKGDCIFCTITADYLLDHGIIVPLCKIGDTVYVIMETSCEDIDGACTICEFYKVDHENLCTVKGKCPYQYRIAECLVTEINLLRFIKRWNKTVFPTYKKAEKALEKMKN